MNLLREQHIMKKQPVVIPHASAVLAATCSAVVVYVLGRHVLGIEPELASVDPPRVTLGSVLVASSVSSALGWALLSGLERWTSRGLVLWTRIAVVVTTLSLLGPLTTPDLTPTGRVLLSLLHLVVGGVTIAVLRYSDIGVRTPRSAATSIARS